MTPSANVHRRAFCPLDNPGVELVLPAALVAICFAIWIFSRS